MMRCKGWDHGCRAEVKDDKDRTLGLARWGWTMAPDPGLGCDAHGPVPGWWYACPDCSDSDHRDAWMNERHAVMATTLSSVMWQRLFEIYMGMMIITDHVATMNSLRKRELVTRAESHHRWGLTDDGRRILWLAPTAFNPHRVRD